MLKMILFFVYCLLGHLFVVEGRDSFGYIANSAINIGDQIQSIAAKRFLPKDAVPINRERIHEFNYPNKVKGVINGWFMHDKNCPWDLFKPLPKVSWPPSPVIEPFFISIHFIETFLPTILSDENIEYLRQHGPIGARDFFTLNELQKRNIPSYFSGCLTLTLENTCKERNDIIYLVDLDDECVAYIKSKVKSPVVVLTHGRTILQFLNYEQGLQYAEYVLDLYRRAKCVVTTRLHAAMPCLAFNTPVLAVTSTKKGSHLDSRFVGLMDHARQCSKEELCKGEVTYDFDNPPKNPMTHLSIRENLIQIMTKWVRDNA